MAKKFIGAFEIIGTNSKLPSEMTDSEIDEWAEAIFPQIKAVDAEEEDSDG